jgi:hypothetical protein
MPNTTIGSGNVIYLMEQLNELQKATEELLLFGARTILADAADYTWEPSPRSIKYG